MRMHCRTCLLLGLVWLVLTSQIQGASTRLGIVTRNPALAPLADLLTVKFSQTDQVELLEREKVNKIWQEQALNASRAGNYHKLGEVLGADGIVLLETVKEGNDLFLITRLLAVRSGVVVDFSRHKLPLADQPGWSDLSVRRQTGLLPKLAIKREEAVPLSFLNVRASLALPSATAMEQQLNVLLNHRLMSQPEFFLLERRQLGTLAAEKELQQVEDTAFWTGSHILDGIIDRDGIMPGKVTLSMTLQLPNNRPKVQFEITGERGNLPSLVERVAIKLLEIIKGNTSMEVWNPTDEAKQYAAEAVWANKWNLDEEAKMAADAAWILGERTEAIGKIRLSSRLPAASTSKRQTGLNSRMWVMNVPEAGKAEMATELLALLDDSTSQLLKVQPIISREWQKLGLKVIETAAEVLEHHREMPTSQPGREQALADLKDTCRQAVRNMDALMATNTLELRAELDLLKLGYCSFWAVSPEEAAAIYRQGVRADTFETNRKRVLLDQKYRFRYWGWEDRDKARELWTEFLRELNGSSDPVRKCDTLLFVLRDKPMNRLKAPEFWTAEEVKLFQAAVDDVLKLVCDGNRGFKDEFTVDQITVFEKLINDRIGNFGQPWAREMMRAQKERAFEKFYHYVRSHPLKPAMQLGSSRLTHRPHTEYGSLNFEWTEERARKVIPHLEEMQEGAVSIVNLEKLVKYSVAELGDYLRRTQGFDQQRFHNLFDNREYTVAEADELRPLLEDFKTRIPIAMYSVQNLIKNKLQTPTSQKEEELQQRTEYAAKVTALKQTLKTAAEYDQKVFQMVAADYFTEEDARELLELWKAYLVRTKVENPLRSAEQHLLARTFTLEEVESYLATASEPEPAVLTRHLVSRYLTKDEAVAIRPAFMAYARRVNLGEKNTDFYLRQIDRAKGTSLPKGKPSP
jgi:hypothetical protein